MSGRNLGVLALIVLLGFLTVYPMAMVLYGSFHSAPPGRPGEFNLDGYAAMFSRHNLHILLTTIEISLVKTALSLGIAVVLAWLIARTDTPGRRVLEILITLPFFIPPILTATAWGMLGNPQVGAINVAWRALTGSEAALIDMYSYGGVIWHMMQYSIPFLFIFIIEGFRAMDPGLEEASRMSGASQWVTVRRITLLLILPVLSSMFLLSFIRGVESFESPLFFGLPAGISVITTEIYESIYHSPTPDYQIGSALSFGIMALMFVLVATQWRLLSGRSYQTVTGKGYTPKTIRLGKWRWVSFGFCILFFLLTVALPIGQLLFGSFFKFFGFYDTDTLTLDHYRRVLDSREFWRALSNSLFLAVVGASATMILGGICAYIASRTTWRGHRLIDVLAWLPWMMPGMVLGVGFLWAFALLPGPVQIYGTIWALLIAYIALGTPIAVRVMSSAYMQLSYDLEECSRVHGGSWWQTLWRIVIALAWPSFAVGWVLTFFGIMRELSASILLYSINSEVLSVLIWRWWSAGRIEEVCVVSLLMMLLVILLRSVQLLFLRQRFGSI